MEEFLKNQRMINALVEVTNIILTLSLDTSQFRYKVDNSSIVARNLKKIMFSEDFADVVIISG